VSRASYRPLFSSLARKLSVEGLTKRRMAPIQKVIDQRSRRRDERRPARAFELLALSLTSLGMYAVMAYTVTLRSC
jgi:hypothetical protein